jgi:hypothetical protein
MSIKLVAGMLIQVDGQVPAFWLMNIAGSYPCSIIFPDFIDTLGQLGQSMFVFVPRNSINSPTERHCPAAGDTEREHEFSLSWWRHQKGLDKARKT